MKFDSSTLLVMKRIVLCCLILGGCPFVTSQSTSTSSSSQALLFADRYTFLSGSQAPDCNGPEENGCNCDNSQYRCRDPNSADLCPNGEGGGCVTTVEGDPICAYGGGKECESSSECADGEACIYVGRISGTLCHGLLKGRQVCAERVPGFD